MIKRIGSALFWSFIVVSSLFLFPIAVLIWALTLPFDRKKVVLHLYTCFWASLYTWLNPVWSVSVSGREKIVSGEAYVMVSNHQSLIDILLLFRIFKHFKWVSKIENFRVPAVGWNMSLNGYIKLIRGDRESVKEMLSQCRKTLARGNSIMMFPEGTRSKDGKLQTFKPGSFELALETHRPILPIVIKGAAEALPKRGLVLSGHHEIKIQILDPIPYEEFAGDSVVELTERARARIADVLSESTEVREPEAVTTGDEKLHD